ncbi:hypothetical protein CYMTET_33731 [Cymbomonas tetramitiformis]|uniref:Uncharacterized protein n=1 Tax=Cymbomonas tetramitiformis TaxID=36881 RepID=A0AAE0FD32_9CHLO|nr:hypothetical protein CYMTET_33731 [Cymbomonas tetramitiformis]
MESKAADKLEAERASRPTAFFPSTNSGRSHFFRDRDVSSRLRAPLALMGDASVATAAVATSTTPTYASTVAASGVVWCLWSAEQANSEDLATVPESFVEEVCALMECEEVEPFATLCHLCDLDLDLGEEHAPASGSPSLVSKSDYP